MKTSLIVMALVALVLLACLVQLSSRPDEPVPSSAPHTSRVPLFEVHVVKSRMNQPLFGLLPDGMFGLPPAEVRFDQTSPAAKIGSVEHDRLELSAEGWDLLIETGGKGGIASGTRLVFPIELAEKQRTLRC